MGRLGQGVQISATTPSTQAHGDSAAVGADGAAADALHKHAMPAATGAPTDVNYLVGTASGDLSAEIAVGTAPGGELGGSWASPTVDGTHSGTAHHAASDAGPPNGTASGELGGTYPSPTVDSTHSGSAHHAQSHSLASHSSEAHSELTSIGANDHHNESHSHAASGISYASGSYTGNGSTSYGISGIGFAVDFVWISKRITGDRDNWFWRELIWTTDVILADDGDGGAVAIDTTVDMEFNTNAIISLDSDGFTVDDAGSDRDPNANGVVYNFWCIG